MHSALELLSNELDEIESAVRSFCRQIPIKYRPADGIGVFIVGPSFYWDEPTDKQRVGQMRVRQQFVRWHERAQAFLGPAPPDLLEQLETSRKAVLGWVDLDTGWNLNQSSEQNDAEIQGAFEPLKRMVAILAATGARSTIVVPDTNALANNPDPSAYKALVGQSAFDFVLLPTVLGELDRLKFEARNESFRDKAMAAITRVKGWRLQGRLIDGVTVNKTITVRAVATEPVVERTLPWLDPTVPDDRILASTIEVQRRFPTSLVILVTSDVNLQNKADAAGIPHANAP